MKNKIKKIHILIALYIVLIIAELFFCVPCHNIQVFKSTQNVPHAEIIGSGYSTIFDISDSDAYIYEHENTTSGKRVNTPQLITNVTLTTIVATAIYFLFIHKKETGCQHINEKEIEELLPCLDFNELAFADEETKKKVQKEYAEAMYEYIKSKMALTK